MISAMASQNPVAPTPSAAFYMQQGNSGFCETGFLKQKPREPSVKGVSSQDTPGGRYGTSWAQRSSSRILLAPGPPFVILKWCLYHWSCPGSRACTNFHSLMYPFTIKLFSYKWYWLVLITHEISSIGPILLMKKPRFQSGLSNVFLKEVRQLIPAKRSLRPPDFMFFPLHTLVNGKVCTVLLAQN